MTAFITLVSGKLHKLFVIRTSFILLLSILLIPFPAYAATGDARITYAEIVSGDDGYVLNADIDLELKPRVVEAINRGISLYFIAELLVERPRWYWFNSVVVEQSLNYRLYYHPITRSYRLSVGNFHQSFDSLDAAVRTMLRIRHWNIASSEALQSDMPYEVSLRFRLDTSQLPKPFQVTVIGSRDWNIGTEWLRWNFLPSSNVSQ